MPRLNIFGKSENKLRPVWQASVPDHTIALSWSPDSRFLAAAAVSGPITIFDAAPVLANSEPAVLASHVGQTVMVVQAERSGRGIVEEALGFLRGCPNIGMVLNKASHAWPGSERFGAYGRNSPSRSAST